MKTINIPITGNEEFDTIVKLVWNAYARIAYDDETFFDDIDVESMTRHLKSVLNRLNRISKFVNK